MKVQFEIKQENMVDFSELVGEHDLENTIMGTTDEGNILIDVYYSRENRDVIDDLEDLAENE